MQRLNALNPLFRAIVVPAILLLTGLGIFNPVVQAQENKDFIPATENSGLLTNLLSQYQEHYRKDIDQLPSANKKDYLEVYQQRWKGIAARFDRQEIYTARDAQEYLDQLVNVIVKANPDLQNHPFHCYFSRSYIPNAEYIGQGIILFNMGLFDRLTDESQAVFILCHEISHYLLRHQEKSIDKYITTINSPEVQAELRKIKNAEFRQREQVERLMKGVTFDSRRHSRDHESEADSMAVELMRRTGVALTGATSTLALLDSVDRDGFDVETYLQRTFNAADYPFRKKWMGREEGLLGGHARLKKDNSDGMADSLKTHPDCSKRIHLVMPLVTGGAVGRGGTGAEVVGTGQGAAGPGVVGAGAAGGMGRAFVVDSGKFRGLQERSRYEVIEYAFVDSQYTQSLWLALKLLQQRPGDAYAVAQVGRVLNGIYQAQKGHTLGKFVDLPAPYYPENYNSLLQFVQNLYLLDLAEISYYFLKAHHPEMDRYELFRRSYVESVRMRAEQD